MSPRTRFVNIQICGDSEGWGAVGRAGAQARPHRVQVIYTAALLAEYIVSSPHSLSLSQSFADAVQSTPSPPALVDNSRLQRNTQREQFVCIHTAPVSELTLRTDAQAVNKVSELLQRHYLFPRLDWSPGVCVNKGSQ